MASSEQAEQPNQVRGVGLPRRDCQGSRLGRRWARGRQWGGDPDALKRRTPDLVFSLGPAPLRSSRPGSSPGDPALTTVPGRGLDRVSGPGFPLGDPSEPSGLGQEGWRAPVRSSAHSCRALLEEREVGKARWYPAVPCREGPGDSRSHGLSPQSASIWGFIHHGAFFPFQVGAPL
jgi:hypothetical protein